MRNDSLLHFLQKHKGVTVIGICAPELKRNDYNTDRERKLFDDGLIYKVREKIEKNPGVKVPTPYDFLGYSNSEVYYLLEIPEAKVNLDGSNSLPERPKELLGIHNGQRITEYQPKNYKNKIYFFGNCVYFGYGVPYNKTVASYLQKLLNDKGASYKVENHSQAITGRYQELCYNLDNLSVKKGDIIFFATQFLIPVNIPLIDPTSLFVRPHNYGEVFADTNHINEIGHKALAHMFFNILTKNNFFKDADFKYPAPPPPPHRYGIPEENYFSNSTFYNNKDLEIYKQKLRKKRLQIGAIVMNCNPFTNGHKALIKYAAARVQKLYIFVVEEDKSEFKFADRLKLVQAGVTEFPNVEVIPSGQFIISQKTFSGYFNKENLQDVAVDSSEDVEIFAREIAPTLGINIRFVGEEPEDTVTRQYNENMKNILPRYGIDFCEIPRREFNGEVISAKNVRAALKVGDFEKIKKLVPKTTLEFLRQNYNKNIAPPPVLNNKIVILILVLQILQSFKKYR